MMSIYRDDSGKTVVDIKDCNTMREVTVLKMGNLGLTEFDTQLINQLDNLEEMDISRNELENIPNVIKLPRLKRLDCSRNRFTGLYFVGQFPQLEEINVDGNSLTFADFCIASYLCPKLKNVGGQEINIQDLNQMVERRMRPKISKIWSDNMQDLYKPSMNDDEFEKLARKFRQLVSSFSSKTAKAILKFTEFRTSMMADEFLVKIRKEEIVEFGGSTKTVKRNYAKKRTKDDPDDLQIDKSTENSVGSVIIVAVADEQGNGIIPAEHASELIAPEQLKDGSSVTLFVENVRQCENTTTKEEVTLSNDNINIDFIDEASARQAERDATIRRVIAANNHQLNVKTNKVKSAIKSDDKQKVVRYWVYDDKDGKTTVKPKVPQVVDAGRKTNPSSVSGGGRRIWSGKTIGEVVATMKSKGTMPEVPKTIKPAIDAIQAAQIVLEINSSPMVVYRGRQKRDIRGSKVRLPQTVKKASVSTVSVETGSGFVVNEPDIPKPLEESSKVLSHGDSSPTRSTSTISENNFPPKKRVRFIDAIKNTVT